MPRIRSTWIGEWAGVARCLRPGVVPMMAALLGGCGQLERKAEPGVSAPPPGTGGAETIPPPIPSGGSSSGMPPSPRTSIDLQGAPSYFRFVGLTNQQWAASVQEVFKVEKPVDVAARLPTPVAGLSEFSNNEQQLGVDARRWESLQEAAEVLAAQVTASEDALRAVYPGTDVQGFIETVGRRAYRRPLTTAEVAELRALFDVGKGMSGPGSELAKGAAVVIRGLLQSPYFVYRSELGEAGAPLSGYEAAAKLSLWLRGGTPSDALLDLAPTLTSAEAVGAVASQMLEEDAARPVLRQFHAEYLKLARYGYMAEAEGSSPDAALHREFRDSADSFLEGIFLRGAGLREMLTSTRGFVGPGMAALYGLEQPAIGLVEAELGEHRAGYFSQVPFLALYGHNDTPSSLGRGVVLAVDVLCSTLGPAAATIPPWPPGMPGETNRQRVTAGTSVCGGACHAELINPLGFALEHFDGRGRYRDVEVNGTDRLPIDSSGSFQFDDGRRDFADNVELMNAIVDSSQAHLCYAKKLASFSLQRDLVEADLPWLTQLARVSQEDGSLKRILLELARSDAFRTHAGPKP